MNKEKLERVREMISEEKSVEARRIFKDIPPEDSVLYYLTKGFLEQKFQNWGDAINAYSRVLELDAENEDAKSNLHLIQNILNFWNPEMFNP